MASMLKSSIQPDSLYTAAQSRELDRIAMEDYGLKGGILMARAGAAAFRVFRFCWPRVRKLLVYAGPGNNGGDGFVLAQLAIEHGLDVKVVSLSTPENYKGDAAQALEAMLTTGGLPLANTNDLGDWQADVIVDAIFGTGLDRAPAGNSLIAINWINQQTAPVLTLDIPSGLDADTGSALGEVIQAEVTISFIGLKIGLVTGRGPQLCGDLYFHDLELSAEIYNNITAKAKSFSILNSAPLAQLKKDTYKHNQGHVLVVGGDKGMAGATTMAAEAAYRCGAGLVSIICHEDSVQQTHSRPEIMLIARGESDTKKSIGKQLGKANMIVLGPGLGQRAWGQSLFSKVLEQETLPLVIDADGLRWLASNPQHRTNWVLTPHPGEAAALLEATTDQVQANRLQAAKNISKKYGGVCVLKGAGTVISSEHNDQVIIIRAGNPGMATAGMGDVLSGLIAALVGQGASAFNAAQQGAWIHSAAADEAVINLGRRSLLATDLFDYIASQVESLTTI
jgi:NAD(P)H-hydrate epimerase